jgi:CRP-like cAMP-binding protein
MGGKHSKKSGKNMGNKIGAFLKSVPILAKMTDEQVTVLAEKFVEKKFKNKEVIIKQGDVGDGFYVILKGSVEVTRVTSGTEEVLGALKEGDFFGEAALLASHNKRGATVTAKGACKTVFLSKKDFQTLQSNKVRFAKRKAVADTSNNRNVKYTPKRPDSSTTVKDKAQVKLINEAVKDNVLFMNLEPAHKKAIIDEMYTMDVKKSANVIVQGDIGDLFYVVEKGCFNIFVNSKKVAERGAGTSFGELALMYNTERAATCTAQVDSKVWVIDRYTYRRVVTDMSEKKFGIYVSFLNKVELLAPLANYEREKIAEALEEVKFGPGEEVIKEGENGDCMFIVYEGEVSIYKTVEGSVTELAKCKRGDFFGERALLKDEPRAASIKALGPLTLLKLDRNAFKLLLGPLEDIFSQEADAQDRQVERIRSLGPEEMKSEVKRAAGKKIVQADLEIIGTLGKGSFGHVQLLKHKETGETYALKSVWKAQVVQTGQQGHIMSEKRVMEIMDHPFIIKLYSTFRDKDKLYFVLEPSLGGELFSVLQDRTLLDGPTARFYASCVVSAFSYMHERNIIYRDLKPENLLLDKDGFLKITDFGFAKDISSGRTWTLCGTPDYLAPEIVSGKGHGKGVDWWTLGIFIYELLASYPPFYDEDPMKTYAKIMHGSLTFPSHFTKEAVSITKKLLHHKPFKRLGVVKGGSKMIMKHPWFKETNWKELVERKVKAPIVPTIKDKFDLGNFEPYAEDEEDEPQPYTDDGTGWDEAF